VVFLCSMSSVKMEWLFILLILVEFIGTDCIGSCKSNYHMITTTKAPTKSLYTTCITIMNNITMNSTIAGSVKARSCLLIKKVQYVGCITNKLRYLLHKTYIGFGWLNELGSWIT
jgi:hypothetical protein